MEKKIAVAMFIRDCRVGRYLKIPIHRGELFSYFAYHDIVFNMYYVFNNNKLQLFPTQPEQKSAEGRFLEGKLFSEKSCPGFFVRERSPFN